jgi:predicted acylesterase/phospholipase RssA
VKKILAVDGGGIRGVLPASVLATVEDSLDEPVVDYFDLVVGTSTGGIIALGLAAGLKAREIIDFYIEHGPGVFCGPHLPRRLRQWTVGKYHAKGLRSALEEVFGDRRLGESKTRVVVPALNLETGEVRIYKTAHHPKFERDFKERVVDVAMATAAAPTFFPAHLSQSGIPLIDGGVFANNPTGLAAVEAVGVLGWQRGDFAILSLGCGDEPLAVGRGRHRNLGRLYWASKLADVFMAGQSSSSMGSGYLLAGHDNVRRISPSVAGGRFGLDVVKEIPALRGLGETEARKALPGLRTRFFDAKVDPFVPHRV